MAHEGVRRDRDGYTRYDADCPQVDLVIVSLALCEDFWGEIVGSATHSGSPDSLHILAVDEQGGQAKVTDLDVHVVVEEQVARLQVTMDNVARMQVLDGARDLDNQTADLGHGKRLALLEHVGERATRAQFEDDICALAKGKGAVKANNVGMAELGVDLEFRDKLRRDSQKSVLGYGLASTVGSM